LRASGVGLFLFEAVAAVDGAEIFQEAEGFEDFDAHLFRLVGEHRHGAVLERFEAFDYAGIGAGCVQVMLAVVREENFQAALAVGFGGVGAENVGHQLGRSVADIAGDGCEGQSFPLHFLQHEIDGVDEVQLRINQRAIQVKKKGTHRGKVRVMHSLLL